MVGSARRGGRVPATNASALVMRPTDPSQRRLREEETMIDPETFPASGAWMPGDDLGNRRLLTIATDRPVRPRARESPARRRDRVRDVGQPRRLRLERRPPVPRVDRRQPRDRARWAGPSSAGVVGGRRRAGSPGRHRSLLRRVRERPRGLSGLDGPGVHRPGDGSSLRHDVPGRHHPRHGARAGPAGGPPRHRSVALGDRRIDGRDAGARVGDHLPGPRAFDRPDCNLCTGHRAADRVGSRSAGGRSGSTLAGRVATTTTPRPATAPTRGWRSPGWSPR